MGPYQPLVDHIGSLGPIGIILAHREPNRTRQDPRGQYRVIGKCKGSQGTIGDHMYWTIQDHTGLYRTIQDCKWLYRTHQDQVTDRVTNIQKINLSLKNFCVRKNCVRLGWDSQVRLVRLGQLGQVRLVRLGWIDQVSQVRLGQLGQVNLVRLALVGEVRCARCLMDRL